MKENFINNHAWWRNGAFAIWFDGEKGKQADWVIGLARNLKLKKYTRAILVSNKAANCPTNIKEWQIVKSREKISNLVTCRCCR